MEEEVLVCWWKVGGQISFQTSSMEYLLLQLLGGSGVGAGAIGTGDEDDEVGIEEDDFEAAAEI